jgi:hypothetical protein
MLEELHRSLAHEECEREAGRDHDIFLRSGGRLGKKRVEPGAGVLREEGGVLTVIGAFCSKKSPGVGQMSKVGSKGKQKEANFRGY